MVFKSRTYPLIKKAALLSHNQEVQKEVIRTSNLPQCGIEWTSDLMQSEVDSISWTSVNTIEPFEQGQYNVPVDIVQPTLQCVL